MLLWSEDFWEVCAAGCLGGTGRPVSADWVRQGVQNGGVLIPK